MTVPNETSPLAGVRVLDMTSVLMGPYATQLLGDFGAEVVKVESSDGDVMRHAGEMLHPAMGHVYLHANRNKRSLAIDLKNPASRAIMEKLIECNDVLVYNLRPQAMARLGLSYEKVAAINPAIIYAGGLGFSQRGRYARRPAYDDLIQSMAGIPWLSEVASGNAPRYMPGAFADRFVGLHLALAIVAAVCYRQRTGQGQRVDVPMYESLLSLVLGEHLGGETFVPAHGRVGYRRTLAKDRRPYRTSDGYVAVLVYTDRQWQRFFDMIGEPEVFARDPRFSGPAARSIHVDEVYGYLQSVLLSRTTAEWVALLEQADIPAAPVSSIHDIMENPHLADTGFLLVEEHPSEGTIRTVSSPFEFSKSSAAPHSAAPTIGQHSVEILRELGYAEDAIDRLLLQKTIFDRYAKPAGDDACC